MNLYHWKSKALADYSDGNIIVVAESVEQAKVYAVEKFKTEYDYLVEMDEFIDDLVTPVLTKLEKDLSKEPIIYHGPVAILINGSA